MAREFEDALSEITGGGVAAAPELSKEQAQAAPADGGNAFEASLAEKLQEATPADRSPDAPEPGGGMER